jgi:hypothetical protein
MATPEGKVKALVKKALKELGAWQYWPVSNGMGMHGVPDVVFCYKGMFFAIEVKAPGRRKHERRGCTALQVMQMKKIGEAGGRAWVVDSQEEMDEIVAYLEAL